MRCIRARDAVCLPMSEWIGIEVYKAVLRNPSPVNRGGILSIEELTMSPSLRLTLSVLLFGLTTTVTAADLPPGCETFTWDVTSELTTLQTPATPITVGTGAGNVVRIELDKHYKARLNPQSDVTFAATPGKPMLDDDAFAGMLTFQVPANGRYRAAITSGHWIDMVNVDDAQVVPTVDFQGRHSCPLVHKIVQFDLEAGRDLALQFAAGSASEVGVVITAAPVP